MPVEDRSDCWKAVGAAPDGGEPQATFPKMIRNMACAPLGAHPNLIGVLSDFSTAWLCRWCANHPDMSASKVIAELEVVILDLHEGSGLAVCIVPDTKATPAKNRGAVYSKNATRAVLPST